MEVSYPFLLKIHHDCIEGLITSDELKEILRLCISYVLRRAICEIPTNSMNKTIATLKNYIRPNDYLNSVKAFFVMQDTYKEFSDVEEKTVQKYSLETYDVNVFTRILFESLDKRIMNLSPAVKKEYKKLYVAYKLDTNFVDIVFQKQRLRISINMKFSEINDPNGICNDITGVGRWGNGDVELFMEHQDELDQIMEIVKQSFDAQAE